ncbi:MAG: sulfite exporter TauE/SafE family protein [Lentisphaeria bacterium]|nr:sulfite exporter TauE/SafE family protein [Lentisphaeria bacterium]
MDIHILILLVVVTLAAFAQGFSGFGFGILLMASMSMLSVDLERTSVFVCLAVMVLVPTLLVRSRQHVQVDWRQALLFFAGIMGGSPVGYWFILRHGGMPVFRVVFGAALILFALHGLTRPHLRRRIPWGYAPLFGFCSGLLSGAFSSGGPPTVLYLYSREEDPRLALGTLQAIFFAAAVYRLGVVVVGGRGIGWALAGQALTAAPFVVLAAAAGYALARRVSSRGFLVGVYALITLAGVLNILKGLG